jgi:vanillate O-demethylase ferredoxin subunit
MELEVIDKTQIAADTTRIRLASPNNTALPPFRAGAHIELAFAGMVRRYSLTGALRGRSFYEICVLRTRPSRGGSAYLHDTLRVGDRVGVDGPFSELALDHRAPHAVFIAGGIGVTPFIPMIDALEHAGASYELHYAAGDGDRYLRTPADLPRLWRYTGRHGADPLDVEAVLAGAPAESMIYVCGPGGLIAAVRERAAQRGWPADRVRFECFGPELRPDDGPVTVHLALTGSSVEVAPGTPILDALLDNGVWASFECRRGECASCMTEVLVGEPDHRDVCLGAAQRKDHMCTCISWARSDELTLNL